MVKELRVVHLFSFWMVRFHLNMIEYKYIRLNNVCTEMYSKLVFDYHLYDDPKNDLEQIDLPRVVDVVERSGRAEKYLFHDLEVRCDV